jgi:hypothetical protein
MGVLYALDRFLNDLDFPILVTKENSLFPRRIGMGIIFSVMAPTRFPAMKFDALALEDLLAD